MRPYRAHRQEKQHRSRRILAGIVLFLLAAAGGFLYRLPVSLQDISGIFQSAVGNFFSSRLPDTGRGNVDEPLRGTIYDRFYNEMAVSYSLFSLYAYPAKIKNHHQAARQLAEILQQPAQTIEQHLTQSYRVMRIADNLDQEQVAAIDRLGIEGISCRRREARFYPANTAAAHVLGYASDGVGLAGVEKRYDLALQPGGYNPEELPEVELPSGSMQGRNGSDLILTIDMALQKELDTYVQELRSRVDADRAMAVALEPGSGRILAASSWPTFNPNYFWQAAAPSRRNGLRQPFFSLQCLRPLLVRAAARIDRGEINGPLLPETVAARDYGLDPAALDETVKKLALLDTVSDFLQNDGEAEAGEDPASENRENLSLLQLGLGLASLVNGGWRHAPVVLDSVYDREQKERFRHKKDNPPPLHVLSPAMGILLRHDLLGMPTRGKKKRRDFFYVQNYVQLRKQGLFSEYSRQQVQVGMYPLQKPEVLLVVGLLQNHLGPDASTLAGKKEIRAGRALLAKLVRLHDQGRERTASHPAGKDKRNFSRFLIARRMDYTPREQERLARSPHMPDLVGMSLRKGMRHLDGRNLLVEIRGSGRIVAQEPAAGTNLSRVKVCRLTLDPRI